MLIGPAASIRSTGIAASRNASRQASQRAKQPTLVRDSWPQGRSTGRSSTRSWSSSRSSSSGRSSSFRTSRPVQNIPKNTAPRRPAIPIPSAESIANLFNQIAGLKRSYSQLQGNYNLDKAQLGTARGLYLKQLADAFQQSQTSALEDYASRGLANSGIQAEGLGRMENEYQGQVSGYNSQYNNQLAQLLQTLQGNQADTVAKRQAIEAQYHRLQAQRAAALKLAGFGG
jgi:hypothetical protein